MRFRLWHFLLLVREYTTATNALDSNCLRRLFRHNRLFFKIPCFFFVSSVGFLVSFRVLSSVVLVWCEIASHTMLVRVSRSLGRLSTNLRATSRRYLLPSRGSISSLSSSIFFFMRRTHRRGISHKPNIDLEKNTDEYIAKHHAEELDESLRRFPDLDSISSYTGIPKEQLARTAYISKSEKHPMYACCLRVLVQGSVPSTLSPPSPPHANSSSVPR